jgi:hypothetical protein
VPDIQKLPGLLSGFLPDRVRPPIPGMLIKLHFLVIVSER